MFKRLTAVLLALCFVCLTVAGCADSGTPDETKATEAPEIVTSLSKPDKSAWKYRADEDFYYQTGIGYCEKPADEKYEQLAIFVPGAYMSAKDNGDGTYTCEPDQSAVINGYTAQEAPIVMPIETGGYAAAPALPDSVVNEYASLTEQIGEYTTNGFICVFPGCRGIAEGAPTGVADLKAAIRYLRYCDDVIAGDAESIFVFGMSGGGAQAAILGAAGDSELYDPYLEAIGAVRGASDAVAGVMAWCPITDLGTANAEYEWMMGCTRTGRSAQDQAISDGLATAFAEYVNRAGFVDKDGNTLTLTRSDEGIYQSGTYYDYIKSEIERSLNNYLSDKCSSADAAITAKEYVDTLNADKKWVLYDDKTKTASITGIADFCRARKRASDSLVAFDPPHSGNTLFGFGDGKGTHFDSILAGVLTELNSEYAAEYQEDLKKTDSFGYSIGQRLNMYSPLYYLLESEDGCGTSAVAKFWRIRTGIEQPNTSVTTEIDLALALEQYDGLQIVDFETVWGLDHTYAERTGNSSTNFIAWVSDCMKK